MPARTAFLGTSDFAASLLAVLAGSDYRPALVVTPPDRRQGRGRRTAPPPAATAAAEAGLPLVQTPDVNEPAALERLRESGAEVGVVCAFGQILREPLLSDLELLNVHPSLLPRWRGAAPIERALMAGDGETGVTIMGVTEGLDSGPIALQEGVSIRPDDDHESLSRRLAELSGELMVRALGAREREELRFREQDESLATYAEKISSAERRLDPSRPAAELERVVRALTPHIGAHLQLPGEARLGVRRASLLEGHLECGLLAEVNGELHLGCAAGVLRIEVVQPPGGRPMPATAYLRGHGVPDRAI